MEEGEKIALAVTYGLVQAPASPYENVWAIAECVWTAPLADAAVISADEGGGVKHRSFLGLSFCLHIAPSAVAEAAHGVERLNLLFAEESLRPTSFDPNRERFTAEGAWSGQTVVVDRAKGNEEVIEWQTGDYHLSAAFAKLANRLVHLAAQLRASS